MSSEGSGTFDGAKPITSPISNNRQLACVLMKTQDRRVTMNPFHGQMSRSTFPRQNELIKERRLSRVKLGAKATFVPFYLFSPPTLPFSALLLYFPLQSNLSALLPLHRTYLIPPPLCLNSLWTPNANSVGHLIRHINSISPLIALIPLCNEFLCGIPSAQQRFTLRC